MSSTERGRTTCPALCSTLAGRLLEGAASKAHLSPMHGTRAARELLRGRAWTDTFIHGLFSHGVTITDLLYKPSKSV